MVETYIFNAPSIKTEEANAKTIYVWPRTPDSNERVDILDLITSDNCIYPFKVTTANEVGATYATGWFMPNNMANNVIKINGTSYTVTPEGEETATQAFVRYINDPKFLPLTASEEGDKVILTAAIEGEAGNLISIDATKKEGLGDDVSCISGPTLTGGVNGHTLVNIKGGTVYMPNNELCIIPDKFNFKVPNDISNPYIILKLNRTASGELEYNYDAIDLEDTTHFSTVYPKEINND
jgi:hypothetical protein